MVLGWGCRLEADTLAKVGRLNLRRSRLSCMTEEIGIALVNFYLQFISRLRRTNCLHCLSRARLLTAIHREN